MKKAVLADKSGNEQDLKPTDAALLALLRRALFACDDASGAIDEGTSWVEVFLEARQQTVLPLVSEAASELPEPLKPPGSILSPVVHDTILQAANNERLMVGQDKVLSLFKEAGIPCAVLKGASAAKNYPKPELRVLGDIDLLVDQSDLARAVETLKQAGYREEEKDHFKHITFFAGSICIELHYHVSDLPQNKAGEIIKGLMRSAVSAAVPHSMNQYAFRGLTNVHQAVSLLLHMQYHITGSGMGLRQLCDWAMFVNYLVDGEWQREIEPVLKRCGLLRFAEIMTQTCVTYLGLPVVKCVWCADVPESLCGELIRDFFVSGNFGRKDPSRFSSSFLVSDQEKGNSVFHSVLSAIKKLNQNAYMHYPALKKLPFLLPFMWVWLPARYIVRNRRGLDLSAMFNGSLSKAKERSLLYSQFRLFEVDEEKQ